MEDAEKPRINNRRPPLELAKNRLFIPRKDIFENSPAVLSGDQYLEKYELIPALHDVVTRLVETRCEKPLDFIATYFANVVGGTNICCHPKFSYCTSTYYNRSSFSKYLSSHLKTCCDSAEGHSAREYHELLQLICRDVPYDFVANVTDVLRIAGRTLESRNELATVCVSPVEFSCAAMLVLMNPKLLQHIQTLFMPSSGNVPSSRLGTLSIPKVRLLAGANEFWSIHPDEELKSQRYTGRIVSRDQLRVIIRVVSTASMEEGADIADETVSYRDCLCSLLDWTRRQQHTAERSLLQSTVSSDALNPRSPRNRCVGRSSISRPVNVDSVVKLMDDIESSAR